ncbi:SDR family NAD(P)-dependent oxidoreductase [Rubrivivax albus]|uniref:SDR family NAD(P)-dependent oxidoreductase n=1 Tax=Rubrivivax albus TaxID=2499835 RepID=A0A3S2TPU2_9BURK|nr:SDR family NAD(P)-dependent oxidoreductase [Rubrivivax albus]RVT53940.1 SDR family NAD(P)-dependent oxidoreductase [Rubrivivax albus]
MKLFIVTGASRGLGRAIAEQLLQPGHHVLAIARRTDPALETLAHERGARVTAWSQDLADAPAAAQRLATWLAQQPAADAVLINNAAALSTPAPLGDSALDELSLAARVGLEAPLLLSAAFLQATRSWGTDRRILNISSGLGRRAMAGSASYCAVKAGMDHFSRAVALEEAARPGGARIVSLAPGIIDTDMQVQLRSADRSRFPDGAQFEAFKTEGRLDSPDAAAAKVLRFLARDDYGQEPVGDVRQA